MAQDHDQRGPVEGCEGVGMRAWNTALKRLEQRVAPPRAERCGACGCRCRGAS